MAQNQRYVDIHFMDPLCRLGTMLAVIPPLGLLSENKSPKAKLFYTWYAYLFSLIFLFGDAYVLYGRFKDSYPKLPSGTLVTTDVVVNICTIITNIFSVLIPSVLRYNNFVIFFGIFNKSDSCLLKRGSMKVKKSKSFYVELLIGHISLLLLLSLDAYIWISGVGFTVFRHYIFRDIQIYHLFIAVMLMYNFALSIQYRFRTINNTLRSLMSGSSLMSTKVVHTIISTNKCGYHNMVRYISQQYETQVKLISLFNNIFGWQILLIMACTMLGLLNSLDILIVYNFTGNAPEVTHLGIGLIVLSILWALWQFILALLVTVSCNRAATEARNTADICYSMLLTLDVVPQNTQAAALRNELLLLSQLCVHRCPTFTAAGFFSVDNSLILAIFGSVTSYFVVLIQFHK